MQNDMQNMETNQQDLVGSNLHPLPVRGLRRAALWTTLLASLVLSACASLGGGSPQENVSQRATERWQALAGGEFTKAYSYNTPGFRSVVTPDGYRNRIGSSVIWVGAEVIRVNCPEADKCLARVRVDYRPVLSSPNADKVSTHIDETWLLEDGKWWFFQKI